MIQRSIALQMPIIGLRQMTFQFTIANRSKHVVTISLKCDFTKNGKIARFYVSDNYLCALKNAEDIKQRFHLSSREKIVVSKSSTNNMFSRQTFMIILLQI